MRQKFSETIRSIADIAENFGKGGDKIPQDTTYMLHMLKNEMSKIQLAVRLIREQNPVDVSEELDIIEHATLQVEDFIARKRVLSGEFRLETEKTDICALIRDAVREQAQGWPGTIEYCMEPEAVMLYCDPCHMKEVFCNLVSNALDAMGEEGILRITCQTTSGQTVQINVSDTGCGIENRALKHIFDLYYTEHPDRSHFGAGLAYCREVIRRHGGSIRVISSVNPENHGTEVILCLPRVARREKEMDEERHKSTHCRG